MKSLSIISLCAWLIIGISPAEADTASLRMYGNWCGPGNTLGSGPPTDPLDGACMQHDICYENNGFGTCGCDVTFMRQLRALSYPNPDIRTRARAMYDALAVTPCDNPTGWAVKQSMMWSDIAADALNGQASPLDVPARWMYMLKRSHPYN